MVATRLGLLQNSQVSADKGVGVGQEGQGKGKQGIPRLPTFSWCVLYA